MPYGRGGSGNLQAVNQANAKIAADLEANQSATESYSHDHLHLGNSAKEPQEYAHSGRGGIGNLYRPRDKTDSERNQDGNYVVQPAEQTIRTAGRGGLGNYEDVAHETREKFNIEAAKDELSRENLRADIEKGVEEHLAMPQRAKLPHGEPY